MMKMPFTSGRFGGFMRSLSCCLLLPILLVFAACGASASGDDDDDGPATDARIDAISSDANDLDFSKVYAHSGTVLYRLDTTTLLPVMIGPFANTGTQGILDIAVDRNDRMLGITRDRVFEINTSTGAATLLTAITGMADLTSLSFVPTDLANPNSAERLIAATDQGTVIEINQTSGVAAQIGAYGSAAGGLISSSGDIVAVSGFGILATVNIGADDTAPDYLASINPTTWAATPLGTGTTYDKIFGIGFWKGKVYGFVDTISGGAIIELNPNTGAATPVNTGAIRWFGAGVTTDAPIIGKPER